MPCVLDFCHQLEIGREDIVSKADLSGKYKEKKKKDKLTMERDYDEWKSEKC